MTTGELVFYSGVGLLAFTLLLAVIFLIKRPKYVPESLSHIPEGSGSTQKLRSGYPTESMTHERTQRRAGTVPLEQEPAIQSVGTVPLEQEPLAKSTETISLAETVPLCVGGSTEQLESRLDKRK